MSRLSSPTISVRAVVLRVRPLGEKDRALTLLCEDGHKLSAAARGARGAKSKLAALAQPFVVGRWLLARGKTFSIVQQAEIERVHSHVASDLSRAAWASYCCELCDALPEELPEAGAFALLDVALSALDAAPSEPEDLKRLMLEATGRWFEARFLELMGYAPQLGRCQRCDAKIVVSRDEGARKIAFSPSSGGTLCAGCVPRDPARLEVRADALRALHRLSRTNQPPSEWALPPQARRDLRDVLRASTRVHLGLRLKSQRFVDEMMDA